MDIKDTKICFSNSINLNEPKISLLKMAQFLMDAKAHKITTVDEMIALKDKCSRICSCRNANLAEAYLKRGPFYLITNFGAPLYMCHPSTDQYVDMDARNLSQDSRQWCARLIESSEKPELEGPPHEEGHGEGDEQ
jgi:hypothetical protein